MHKEKYELPNGITVVERRLDSIFGHDTFHARASGSLKEGYNFLTDLFKKHSIAFKPFGDGEVIVEVPHTVAGGEKNANAEKAREVLKALAPKNVP